MTFEEKWEILNECPLLLEFAIACRKLWKYDAYTQMFLFSANERFYECICKLLMAINWWFLCSINFSFIKLRETEIKRPPWHHPPLQHVNEDDKREKKNGDGMAGGRTRACCRKAKFLIKYKRLFCGNSSIR